MMNSVVICNQHLKANGALFFWGEGWGEAQREREEGAKATKY